MATPVLVPYGVPFGSRTLRDLRTALPTSLVLTPPPVDAISPSMAYFVEHHVAQLRDTGVRAVSIFGTCSGAQHAAALATALHPAGCLVRAVVVVDAHALELADVVAEAERTIEQVGVAPLGRATDDVVAYFADAVERVTEAIDHRSANGAPRVLKQLRERYVTYLAASLAAVGAPLGVPDGVASHPLSDASADEVAALLIREPAEVDGIDKGGVRAHSQRP